MYGESLRKRNEKKPVIKMTSTTTASSVLITNRRNLRLTSAILAVKSINYMKNYRINEPASIN